MLHRFNLELADRAKRGMRAFPYKKVFLGSHCVLNNTPHFFFLTLAIVGMCHTFVQKVFEGLKEDGRESYDLGEIKESATT